MKFFFEKFGKFVEVKVCIFVMVNSFFVVGGVFGFQVFFGVIGKVCFICWSWVFVIVGKERILQYCIIFKENRKNDICLFL